MNNMTSIYQQLTGRIGDRAYSLARATHRHRDSTIECQIYAAVSDAIIQHRNDRHELALAIAEIVAAMPLTDRQAAATERERDEMFALFPAANLQQRFARDETAQDRMDRPGESEEEISMRRTGTMNYQPWNEVIDTEKLEALAASMGADGWTGAPLVADNDQLLTGSHRYVAAGLAGIDVPVIDIRELVEDWDALLDDTGFVSDVAIEIACSELPHDIKAEYGIDIH